MTHNWLKQLPLALIVRASTVAVMLSLGAMAQDRVHRGSYDGVGDFGAAAHGAPEIDPNLAKGGILLLIAGTLALTGRRRAARA